MAKQPETVQKVLEALHPTGLLSELLIIGSWCAHFYRYRFESATYHPILKTRDLDFLIPLRQRIKSHVNLEKLLKPLGFDVEFLPKGYLRLESEELEIEFLAHEIGPEKDKPLPLPQLGMNAQRLRHLDILWSRPIKVSVEGIPVRLPHPADFAIHKLIVSQKRKTPDKRRKDLETACAVLDALFDDHDIESVGSAYKKLSKTEMKTFWLALRSSEYSIERLGDLQPRIK